MKSRNLKITALLLACLLGMTAVGCKEDATSTAENSSSSNADTPAVETLPVETDEKGEAVTDANGEAVLASDATDFMIKEIEFSWGEKDESSDNTTQDPTESPEQSENSEQPAAPATTSYVVVTDDAGAQVTEADGQVVTEVVTQAATENNGNVAATTEAATNAPYTPGNDTFQAYWLDMAKYKDIVFNGDFIEITFKVKENTPDGNYPVRIQNCEFANWDAQALVPSVTNGCVTVGSATPEVQTATNGSDFNLYADAVTANAGDEITMVFHIEENPGMVAFVFRFQYDSNALEIVDASVGDDCRQALRSMESNG